MYFVVVSVNTPASPPLAVVMSVGNEPVTLLNCSFPVNNFHSQITINFANSDTLTKSFTYQVLLFIEIDLPANLV